MEPSQTNGSKLKMILGLDHAQITVPEESEKEARQFYCDFMGLKEIEKPENRIKNGGFWLQVAHLQVHVGIESGVNRTQTKAHLAYRVKNLEDWRLKLKNKGIEVIESAPFPDASAFEFRDPFGNRVEIIQRL